MRYFNIKLAGKTVQICANYSKIYFMCDAFKVNEKADFCVEVNVKDYEREAEEYKRFNKQGPPSYVYLEPLAILRKISDRFIDFNIFLLHGAAIVLNNEAYIFTAHSGTGKTTHILKWMEKCPGAYVLNGDKPFILTFEDGRQPLVCGSPWAGKEEMFTNAMIPLKAIIMLERSENNDINEVSFIEALPTLLQQVYRPDDEARMRQTLELLKRLKNSVTFWRFKCNNFKEDSFFTSYNALITEE